MIGAIPTICIGLISYWIASGDIGDKVKEGNLQILLQTQLRVEQVLKTLELSAIQYINLPMVVRSQNESLTPDNFVKINDLTTGLYNLQTFSGISEIYLINLDYDWMIHNRGFRKFSDFAYKDTFAGFAAHPENLFVVTDDPPAAAAQPATSPPPPPVIRMVLKIPFFSTSTQPKELFVIDILKSEVAGLLTQNDKLGTINVLDPEGRPFLSAVGDAEQRINQAVVSRIRETGQTEGFFNASGDRKQLGVTYRVSPANGWIYVSMVSIGEITKQSKKIGLATLLVCVLTMGVVTLMAFYGSRRMYSPIRRLFEFMNESNTGDSDKNKADEFAVIENRFRTLFSTRKQLEQQVRGQFSSLRDYFVLQLFTEPMSEQDFADKSRLYGFSGEWKRLAVLAMQIDTLQDTRYRTHDKELLLFAINNMVGELIAQEERFSPILLEQSQVTLIMSDLEDPAQLKDHMYKLAETIQLHVKQYLQLQASVGISRPFGTNTGIMEAYRESLAALKSRISLGNEIIVHYEDMEAGRDLEAEVYAKFRLLEDQLLMAVKTGDSDKIGQTLRDYNAAVKETDIPFGEFQFLLLLLISKVFQFVREQGMSVHKMIGEHASVEAFMKLNTLDEMTDWFRNRLLEPIAVYMKQQAESQYINIANEMVNIVRERFDQDLSLETCGAILNFHPVYLSRVFKKELGVNFSDYVADYRMNVAKSWLESTDMKVAEIAEKLNYSNTTAFIRTFRKKVGVTPGQYKDQLFKS